MDTVREVDPTAEVEDSETGSVPDNMADFNAKVIAEFRANGGKVGGMFEGAPMVILHTTGAKSGKPHVSPLVYFPFEGQRYIMASKGGAPTHPAWYHNLVANPEVTIEIGDATETAIARVLGPDERAPVWSAVVAAMPNFGEYERSTTRTIPVIALDPQKG